MNGPLLPVGENPERGKWVKSEEGGRKPLQKWNYYFVTVLACVTLLPSVIVQSSSSPAIMKTGGGGQETHHQTDRQRKYLRRSNTKIISCWWFIIKKTALKLCDTKVFLTIHSILAGKIYQCLYSQSGPPYNWKRAHHHHCPISRRPKPAVRDMWETAAA